MEKIIHYCWFGPKPLPKLAKKCLKSWRKYLPDYKIIKWNEENVDLEECEFIKGAYQQKKWAFVADYARTKALYKHGGIYFDTDMEIIKDINFLLDNDYILGVEDSKNIAAGVMIVKEKANPYIKELLDEYKSIKKFDENIDLFKISIPKLLSKQFDKYGFDKEANDIQILNKGKITIYPRDYFYPLSYDRQNNLFTENTCMIHYYDASWVSIGEKISLFLKRNHMGKLIRFVWPLLGFFKRINAFLKLIFSKLRIIKLNDKEKAEINDILWSSRIWRGLIKIFKK